MQNLLIAIAIALTVLASPFLVLCAIASQDYGAPRCDHGCPGAGTRAAEEGEVHNDR